MKLALDQALNTTGFSLFSQEGELVEYGQYTTNRKLGVAEKLQELYSFLNELIEEKGVSEIAFEEIQLQGQTPSGDSIPNNVQTFKKLSYVQAVIMITCNAREEQIPFSIVPPSSWRSGLGIAGKTRDVQKRNAQKYVKDNFNIEASEDVCDSICIGLHAFDIVKNANEINWE